MRHCLVLGLVAIVTLLVSGPGTAGAAPMIGDPAPVADYGADDGTELFVPSDQVLAIEWLDYLGDVGYVSSFGFYRASDPTALIPVFSPADQFTSGVLGDGPAAIIDFTNGWVLDYDLYLGGTVEIESVFAPGNESIGFYLTIVDATGGGFSVYTQPTLNTLFGGADLFGTFPHDTTIGQYLLTAELPSQGGEILARVDVLSGVAPIPEPGSEILFVAGLLIVAVALRARKAPSTSS